MKRKTLTAKIVSQAELADRLKVDRQRITKLLDAGIITARPDRRIDLATELPKAIAYLKAQAEATALHSGKTALQAKRLSLQCELLQAELEQVRGKVHDRHECALSIAEAVSRLNSELMQLGSRLAAQLPEVPRLKEIADASVDELLDRVRAALQVELLDRVREALKVKQ
jgi:hypothetical protein